MNTIKSGMTRKIVKTMNVLIVNPIVYTSETKKIKRAASIKDTMIYDLCLAFQKAGHTVTLFAAEPFRPLNEEEYPFSVIWGRCAFQKVCMPHCLPFMPELPKHIKTHKREIDLIISSEVFSLNTLNVVFTANRKLIVWHELAKHNAIMKKIPSRIWYHIVARFFMGKTCVVGRSEEAKSFIGRFCRGTDSRIIDHGVNLDKFQASREKKDYYVVCSQLIQRKRIDGIISKFHDYLQNSGTDEKLYIIGMGPLMEELQLLTRQLQMEDNVHFLGKLTHEALIPILAHAKAMFVNTEKDNNMISIVESIAVGTPVLTTKVPLNASYIERYRLGIADAWTAEDIVSIGRNNDFYVEKCMAYRQSLSTEAKVAQFEEIYRTRIVNMEKT